MAQQSVDGVIVTVGDWFAKLPALPANWREGLVKIIPWIAIIFGVLGVVLSIASFGILAFLSPLVAMGGGLGAVASGPLAAVFLFVSSLLLVLAYKGTKDRRYAGWRFLFFSEVVSLGSAVVFFSVGGIFWGLVSFYLLFQIRSYYK